MKTSRGSLANPGELVTFPDQEGRLQCLPAVPAAAQQQDAAEGLADYDSRASLTRKQTLLPVTEPSPRASPPILS